MNTIKKKLGFGCMRLPMKDSVVDTVETCKMVDAFLDAGFNYFDTAHGYLGGKSEIAVRDCLTSRHPRDRYLLADKLSDPHFSSEDDIRPLFQQELDACGVDYFDFYLMHAQNQTNYEKYKRCRAYETAFALKAEGKVRHVGLSFHDKASVLEQILTDYPAIEFVQIQLNYIDYDDPAVEGRQVYEVCRKFGKPVIVMEPVKGGCLVNLPPSAQAIFDQLDNGSNASYALRYAAGFDGVIMVLSGMGNMDMMTDNVGTMQDFKPLTAKEKAAVEQVCDILKQQNRIPCTACNYCTERCPRQIPIPDLFACLNEHRTFHNWNAGYYYDIYTKNGGKASTCIGCGVCETACPQHLPIRDLLKEVVGAFEKRGD